MRERNLKSYQLGNRKAIFGTFFEREKNTEEEVFFRWMRSKDNVKKANGKIGGDEMTHVPTLYSNGK